MNNLTQRQMASMGGKARAAKISAARRVAIAKMGGEARARKKAKATALVTLNEKVEGTK